MLVFSEVLMVDSSSVVYTGMNVNIRETGGHIEFEPSSYYAAFSCELEAAAYPMWSVLGHLTDPQHAPLARRIISAALTYLQDWLDAVHFTAPHCDRVSTSTPHPSPLLDAQPLEYGGTRQIRIVCVWVSANVCVICVCSNYHTANTIGHYVKPDQSTRYSRTCDPSRFRATTTINVRF